MIASLFRDSLPWLYELGMEVYRTSRHGKGNEMQQAAREFRQAVEMTLHGPMSRELLSRNKEMYMLMEEIDPLLDRALGMLEEEGKSSRSKAAKDLKENFRF